MVQENKRKENGTYFSRKISKKMLPKTDGCQLSTRVGKFDAIIYKIKTLKVSLTIMFVISMLIFFFQFVQQLRVLSYSFLFSTADIKAHMF